MATIRAYDSLNLVDRNVWNGDVISATSREIIISDGFRRAEYDGVGFQYSGSEVVGGTLNGFAEFQNGRVVFEVSGLSVRAAFAFDAIDTNDLPRLFTAALDGDDSIFGSRFDDLLHGYDGDDDIIGNEGNDTIFGGFGNDLINGGAGANTLNGGSGFDVAVYRGNLSAHTIDFDGSHILVDSFSASDQLIGIERLAFDNATIAFDDIAAYGYRLYQAAFDRVPDVSGLSYWVDRLDDGLSLQTMAAGFIASLEFRGLYGSNPTDVQFVDLLYRNVLGRSGDNSGLDYWLDRIDDGTSRAQVLASFADSVENRDNVAADIVDGIRLDYGVFA